MSAKDRLLDAIEQAENRRQSTDRLREYDDHGLRLLTPSAFDGCDRANVFAMIEAPATNTTDGLAAWMGTSIHEAAEAALRSLDPFGDTHVLERRLPPDPEVGLGSGRCDWLLVDEDTLIDLKTVKKKDRRYFPSQGKIQQVNVYARQAIRAGYEVKRVEILGLCRDGNRLDIMDWGPEDYSPEIAERAVEHLQGLRARALRFRETGDLSVLPPPSRPARTFCSVYCEFYDPDGLCGGVVR